MSSSPDHILDDAASPAERRRIRVREAILEAAERLFAEEGEEGLSIRRIAEEIDYSPAAIYKYFGSKDELVGELKEAFFARLLASVHEILDQREPFARRARLCVGGYIRKAIEKPHHYVAAFSGVVADRATCGEDAAFNETNRGKAFSVLTAIVGEGLECGAFRPELPLLETAESIWASMHGLSVMIAHLPQFPSMPSMQSEMSQKDFIDFHADLLIRSLEVAPGRETRTGRA